MIKKLSRNEGIIEVTIMDWGRTPASDIGSLVGADINSGKIHLAETNNIEELYAKQAQIPTFGNKCGHNPKESTSFIAPNAHKRRPPIIEQAKKKLAKLYIDPMISAAGQLSFNPNHKTNKDGSYRQVRSEMRDITNNCVGEALLHYFDRKTFYIGFEYAPGKFHYMGINSIYKAIKESIKDQYLLKTITYERVRRAIKIYEECGYIEIQNEKKLMPDGSYISLPARLRFTEMFFKDLDIDYAGLLSKTLLEEKKKVDKEKLKIKEREYKKTYRAIKKDAKEAKRAMHEMLSAHRNKKPLKKEEKDYLSKELPGYHRERKTEELYPEFISKILKRPPK